MLGALENLFSLAVLGLNSILWLFTLCLLGRKRKRERERKTIPLFGREIEGEKKNWGELFSLWSTIFLSSQNGSKQERWESCAWPPPFFFSFPFFFFFMNKNGDQCCPHTPGPCTKMGTMHGTTQGRTTCVTIRTHNMEGWWVFRCSTIEPTLLGALSLLLLLFFFFFMNKKGDQCYPHTPGPCMKMGTMHGTT